MSSERLSEYKFARYLERYEMENLAFKSKTESACVGYFQKLLKDDVVQDKLAALGCTVDLDNSAERDNVARCMAEAAPVHIMDFLDDIFEDIYTDIN